MVTLTDPARELAEIAQRLTQRSNKAGETFLAEQFGVTGWSTDFVKIIACILERADLVAGIIQRSAMDDDHKRNALNELNHFKSGFTGNALRQPWNTGEHGLAVMKDHGRPLQYLSSVVRAEVSYPKLSEEEIEDLVALIDAYLEEVSSTDEGPDFVRQAIIDGLKMFHFQLTHIGWMGAGYVLTAFREVLLVYEASKREYSSTPDFDAEGALRGLWAIVTKFKEKVDAAQSWADSGSSVWKFYQLGTNVATPLLLAGKLHGGG